MRAAIYARKSTDSDAGVARQIAIARDFATERGWTMDDEHVYSDNDVSGAISNRPGLNALLAAVESSPRPWDVLVTMNGDRLSRGSIADSLGIQQRIVEAGVEIWKYQSGTRVELSNATDELKGAIDAFGAREYRDQIAQKVRPAMRKKAAQGHQTGTAALGYTSVTVGDHKELAVDPRTAAIVVQIFEWSAAGWGIKRIADELNVQHPGLRRKGWSGAGVRETLGNPLYRGEIVFGKSRQVTTREGKHKVAVPEKDWVRVERPDLRIVPEPLWRRVHARKAELFTKYQRTAKGRLQGRPESSLNAQHLLAGFCVCSECGGRLVVWSASGARAKYRYLVCWRHRSSKGACGNKRSVPLEPLTKAIVGHFTKDVLTPEAIARVAADLAADADASPERIAARRAEIEGELTALDGRIEKWTDALGEGGSRSLVERIKQAEAQQDALRVRLAQLDDTQTTIAKWTEAGHQGRVEALLSDWQGALAGAPVVGRQILKKLLTGPIILTSWVDSETGQTAHSYRAEGTYGAAISGALATGWNLTAFRQDASERTELRGELKALAETVPTSDGRGGPTS